MFDFIQRGIVSPRDTDFTARLASPPARRADLEQEILLVERHLSAADRLVASDAIDRLGEVILGKLRSNDPLVRARLRSPVRRQGGGSVRLDHHHGTYQTTGYRCQ